VRGALGVPDEASASPLVSAASSPPSAVLVVLGAHLRTADLRRGAVMAPLHALVRASGSAAVLPHVTSGGTSGGRARAAARLREQAPEGARAFVFGCGGCGGGRPGVDAGASAADAPAVLAAAGWVPGAVDAAPVLLIACTPEEGGAADAAADAAAMAAAHDALVAAVSSSGGGDKEGADGPARVSVLAVRPPPAGEGHRRRLQMHDDAVVGEEELVLGEGALARAAEASAAAAGRPRVAAAEPRLRVGAGGQYETCDARCQSQVKWLQGMLATGVMVVAMLGGLTMLGALQGPSRFEKAHEQ